jgi:photosystem II stability/assembly factor-like uncharacterized protein
MKRCPLNLSIGIGIAVLICSALTQAQPPYQWKSVAIGGGGYVAGIIMHPAEQGLIYARTDVGGAYRYNAGRWIPLTDWVSQKDGNLMGCESIAVDPADPNRLYLALGTYTNSWAGNGAIVRSSNRGQSFERTDVPFKMGGNDPGRGVGERLAVDPNDGRVLLFGSRAAGLWRSTDQAKTWNRVTGFPSIATSAESMEQGSHEWADGIGIVKFDAASSKRGTPTPVIYAGVCTNQTCLFRSLDGGASWTALPGQPIGLRPTHMVISSDGRMYVSYSDSEPPGSPLDGAVFCFVPATGVWTDLTPIKPSRKDPFGYGAVTVDARHPLILMASTVGRWGHGDTLFRSTDAGRHWSAQTVGGDHRDKTLFDVTDAPWANSIAPHWTSDIELDPFDSTHAMFVTGFGIWSTHDAGPTDADKPAHWSFDDNGLEETVPLQLVSPGQGAHLISVIGDFDGFTHDDLDASPKRGRHQPSIGSTSGLDFAELSPKFVVRTGGHGQGFYSQDGGETWTAFASVPVRNRGGGTIAVSSDGSKMLWELGGSGGRSGGRPGLFRSVDRGSTWSACTSIARAFNPISDRVNAKRFYVFDNAGNRLLESRDGGSTFSSRPWDDSRPIQQMRAVPGVEGDIWICAGDRLFRSAADVQSAEQIRSVQSASKVGFGKAAPGRQYPAIYIVGQVAGVAGVFRSDDEGVSWTRINDDEHQFGWLNVIIGDPRIYGRVYVGTTGRGIIYGDTHAD